MDAHSTDAQIDSDNEEVQSRSVHPVTARRTNDDILHHILHLDIKPNNYFIDLDTFKHPNKLLMEILKGHPLSYALSASVVVPNIYVQQLWHSIVFVSEGNRTRLDFMIDRNELSISLASLRKLLHLPKRSEMPNKRFEDFATEEEICRDFMVMGYTTPLHRLMDFKRKHVPGIWNHFFGILLKCLTAQSSGHDKTNRNSIQLFHAFCFSRNVDFAVIIWNEMKDLVIAKNKSKMKPFIPFLRFFQLLIAESMELYKRIDRRPPDKRPYEPPHLLFQRSVKEDDDVPSMVIPLPLLLRAHPDVPEVADYKRLHYRHIITEPTPNATFTTPTTTTVTPRAAKVASRPVEPVTDPPIPNNHAREPENTRSDPHIGGFGARNDHSDGDDHDPGHGDINLNIPSTMGQSTPITPTQTETGRGSNPETMPLDELQRLFYRRLLAESSNTVENATLIDLLRQQQPPAVTRQEFVGLARQYDRDYRNHKRTIDYILGNQSTILNNQSLIKSSQTHIEAQGKWLGDGMHLIMRKLDGLTETCSQMAARAKRKHDDEDNPEGEKRTCISNGTTPSQPFGAHSG